MFSGAVMFGVVSSDSVVLLYFLPFDIYYILLFVILFSTEKNKAKRIMCVILLAFLY